MTERLEELRKKSLEGALSSEESAEILLLVRGSKKLHEEEAAGALAIVQMFSAALKDYREQHKLTTREFSELSGIHPSFVSQVENIYKQSLSLDTMLKIANAVGKRLDIRLAGKRNSK